MIKVLFDTRFPFYSGLGRYGHGVLLVLDKYPNSDFEISYLAYEDYNFKNLKYIPYQESKYEFMQNVNTFFMNKKYDIYHSAYIYFPTMMSEKSIITLHDLIKLTDYYSDSKYYYFEKALHRYCIKMAIKKNVKIITVSEASRDVIKQDFNISPIIIPNRVPLLMDKTYYDRYIDEHYVLHIGNGKPYKNLQRLVEGFLRSNSNYKLALIGSCCNSVSDHPRIIKLGKISDDKLYGYISHSKALLAPSIVEGCGIPLLEAASLNVPIIASDIPAFREFIKDVYWIDPFDINQIKEAIENISTFFKSPKMISIPNDEELAERVYDVYYEKIKSINTRN